MSRAYISKDVIEHVLARSGGSCEICGRCYQMEMAHIEAKGMGGIGHKERAERIDHEDNIAHLCVFCHWWMSHAIKVVIQGTQSYFNDPKLPKYEAKAKAMGIWKRHDQGEDILLGHSDSGGAGIRLGDSSGAGTQPEEEELDSIW